jgi:hypothetical protein
MLFGRLKVPEAPRRLGGQQVDFETGRPHLKTMSEVLPGLGKPIAVEIPQGGTIMLLGPEIDSGQPCAQRDHHDQQQNGQRPPGPAEGQSQPLNGALEHESTSELCAGGPTNLQVSTPAKVAENPLTARARTIADKRYETCAVTDWPFGAGDANG